MKGTQMKIIALLVGLLATFACGGKSIPVVVGQAGLSIVQTIGQLQQTTKQLTDAGTIPPAVAIVVQEKLLALNERAKPLPGLLQQVEAMSQAGTTSSPTIDQTITLLQVLSSELSIVVAGVPVSDAIKAMLDMVRAAQTAISTTLVEVAKLKGVQ